MAAVAASIGLSLLACLEAGRNGQSPIRVLTARDDQAEVTVAEGQRVEVRLSRQQGYEPWTVPEPDQAGVLGPVSLPRVGALTAITFAGVGPGRSSVSASTRPVCDGSECPGGPMVFNVHLNVVAARRASLALMVDGLRTTYPLVLRPGDQLVISLPAGWSRLASSDSAVLAPDPVASNLPLPVAKRLLAREPGRAAVSAGCLSPPSGCPYYTDFRLDVEVVSTPVP